MSNANEAVDFELDFSETGIDKKNTPEPGTPVSSEENEYLNKLFESTKRITTDSADSKAKHYFTIGNSAVIFNMDGTSLEPNLTSMMGKGTFEERYYKQLENMVFGPGQELETGRLITLLMLTEQLTKKKYPIKIKSGKYKSTVNKVVGVLNNFYNENFSILEAMYKMFNDATSLSLKEKKE